MAKWDCGASHRHIAPRVPGSSGTSGDLQRDATCGEFFPLMRRITIKRARTWHYRKMRRCIEQSKALAPSLPFQSWLDYTTNTSGYSFRKGQVLQSLHKLQRHPPSNIMVADENGDLLFESKGARRNCQGERLTDASHPFYHEPRAMQYLRAVSLTGLVLILLMPAMAAEKNVRICPTSRLSRQRLFENRPFLF
jgi:hypothetical protein